MLTINAQRRVEEKTEQKGFTRTLPLAEGATEDDITAAYKDGVLEIRVPVAPQVAEPRKVSVSHG